MFRKSVFVVVFMTIVVVLMPGTALAQSPWQWPPQWWPAQPQPQPGPGSWALVSPQLSVGEGFYGQLVLTMRLTSNSQNLEQVQAVVSLGPEVNGYFLNSNQWGVTVDGSYAYWQRQLQPREDVTADVIIQLQGTSQELRQGCLIATMTTSVRDINGYWQSTGYPLQLYKSW